MAMLWLVTVPVLDFALMRQRVGVPQGLDVLTEVPSNKQKI